MKVHYYAETIKNMSGEYLVHRGDCIYLPAERHRRYLGHFVSCSAAAGEILNSGLRANGCPHCCRECHAW